MPLEYDPQEKELVKKLDSKLIPFLIIFNLFVLLDRSNQLHAGIPNAGGNKIFGIQGGALIWSLFSFSIGSAFASFPCTIMIRHFGAPQTILASWGVTMGITALISNFIVFSFARFMIGIFQSGLLSCTLVYIMSYYTKEESATRIACMTSFSALIHCFADLVFEHFSKYQDSQNLTGRQWVYMFQGLCALVTALIARFYFASFPETCSFLNPADRVLAVARGRDGYEKSDKPLAGNPKGVKSNLFSFNQIEFLCILQDQRIWLMSVAYLFVTSAYNLLMVAVPEVAGVSFGLFSVCETNCSSAGEVKYGITFGLQILTILPFGIALFGAYFSAVYSDEHNARSMCLISALGSATLGFFFLAVIPSPSAARYILGIVPAVTGILVSIPSLLSHAIENSGGETERAATATICVFLGNSFGGLLVGILELMSPGDAVSNIGVYWTTVAFLVVAIGCIMAVEKMNDTQNLNGWGNAPGLRRLLNDADEGKAWDIELDNADDFLKSSRV